MVPVRRSPLAEDSARTREAIAQKIGVKSLRDRGSQVRRSRRWRSHIRNACEAGDGRGPTRLSGGAAPTHTLALMNRSRFCRFVKTSYRTGGTGDENYQKATCVVSAYRDTSFSGVLTWGYAELSGKLFSFLRAGQIAVAYWACCSNARARIWSLMSLKSLFRLGSTSEAPTMFDFSIRRRRAISRISFAKLSTCFFV